MHRGHGTPLAVILTAGNRNDVTWFRPLADTVVAILLVPKMVVKRCGGKPSGFPNGGPRSTTYRGRRGMRDCREWDGSPASSLGV